MKNLLIINAGRNLISEVSDEIANLHKVHRIRLHKNRLDHFPVGISKMKSIEKCLKILDNLLNYF